MKSPLHIMTTVLPGGCIRVESPELAPGQTVDVWVTPHPNGNEQRPTFLSYLKSLPSRRTVQEWEAFERDFSAERDAWDR